VEENPKTETKNLHNQEILFILWNMEVYGRIRTGLQPVPN